MKVLTIEGFGGERGNRGHIYEGEAWLLRFTVGSPELELDRAAPFSLSFGAPVTAQFVIEDHVLRHSWHHLGR
jgi:hypothetical protein